MATPDEIREAVADDVETGIESATADGVTVNAMDPEKRLNAADRLAASDAAAQPHFGLRMTKLRSPGAN